MPFRERDTPRSMAPAALVPSRLSLRAATPGDIEAIAILWHGGWLDAHLGHVPESIRPHRRLVDFRERVPARIPATAVPPAAPPSSAS
jgi:hypothetical protein